MSEQFQLSVNTILIMKKQFYLNNSVKNKQAVQM